ncbi:MAG: sugar transferase [Firmicutes bacterium]|nr:sugar transferase [Bacillota bacterium]
MNILKRIFDFIVAISLFIVTLPIMAIVAILVRWKLGEPIIFKQKRPGLHGVPFYIYKFRTMTDEKDADGNLLPSINRLTPLGKTLRRLSLDELPQLVNIIKGNLSLVGPRPLLMEYLPLYSPEQARRHDVRPGITGWAQVNGRNTLSWEEKFQLDVWYVDNQSFLLDIKIILMTVYKVLRSEGVSPKGKAFVEKFRGM